MKKTILLFLLLFQLMAARSQNVRVVASHISPVTGVPSVVTDSYAASTSPVPTGAVKWEEVGKQHLLQSPLIKREKVTPMPPTMAPGAQQPQAVESVTSGFEQLTPRSDVSSSPLLNNSEGYGDDAPQACTGLKVQFIRDSLRGTFTFTMPTLSTWGPNEHLLPDKLIYNVYIASNSQSIDGGEVQLYSTGVAGRGETVTVEVEASAPGWAFFKVVPALEDGTSGPVASLRKFLGEDADPVLSTIPQLTMGDSPNTLNLSWITPDKGIFNGWINPEKLAYRITRNDGVVIADNHKATFISDTISDTGLQKYWYTINCIYDGNITYTGTRSNGMMVGEPLPFPYVADDEEDFGKYSNLYVKTDKGEENWRFTPPLAFESGAYKVSMIFVIQGNVDLQMGYVSRCSPEFMIQELLPSSQLTTNTYYYECYILVEDVENTETGYVGFGVIAHDNSSYLAFQNVNIEKLKGTAVPSNMEQFSATATAPGSHSAKVSFVTPTTDVFDRPASLPLTRVDVLRDNAIIKRFNNPDAGEAFSFIDNNLSTGYHVYEAVAYNDAGSGAISHTYDFFGPDTPVAPDSVWLEYHDGDLAVKWHPASVGANGYYPGEVTYTLLDAETNVIVEGISDNRYVIHDCDLTGENAFFFCYVGTVNEESHSEYVRSSEPIVKGDANQLPYRETFYNGTLSSPGFIGEYHSGISLPYYDIWAFGTGQSSDNDELYGGCAYVLGVQQGAVSNLCLRPFDFSSAENPVLSFDVTFGNELNSCELFPYFINGVTGEWYQLQKAIKDSTFYNERGWHKVEIPLDVAKGCPWGRIVLQYVDIGLFPAVFVDDIRLRDVSDNDLALKSFAITPFSVKGGEPVRFDIVVVNDGSQSVSGNEYNIDIYQDESLLASLPGEGINKNESNDFSFTFTPQQFIEADEMQFYAIVNYHADNIPVNNTSDTISIGVIKSMVPQVIDLDGQAADNTIRLHWTEPECEHLSIPLRIVDGGEAYRFGTGGAQPLGTTIAKIGDWISYDPYCVYDVRNWYDDMRIDGNKYGAFQIFDNKENHYTHLYEWMWNHEEWEAFSGNNVFASFSATKADNSPVSTWHWLISPVLSGENVTGLTFRASTPFESPNASTTFWVGYTDVDSVTFDGTTDFTRIDYFDVCGAMTKDERWQEFSFSLPEGVKHFTIVHVGVDAAHLFIDDIAYTTLVEDTTLTLTGYNVYRDGVLIAEGVPQPEFADVPDANGTYTYRVTALYEGQDESQPSNEVTVVFENTGVHDVETGKKVAEVTFYNVAGMASHRPHEGVNIVVTTFSDGSKKTVKIFK